MCRLGPCPCLPFLPFPPLAPPPLSFLLLPLPSSASLSSRDIAVVGPEAPFGRRRSPHPRGRVHRPRPRAFSGWVPNLGFLGLRFGVSCAHRSREPGSGPLPQDSFLPLSSLAPRLHHLDISNLGLTDSVLAQLSPSLCQCRHLATLDVSHNPVTASGLVSLLVGLSEEAVPLTTLRLRQLKSPDDCFWSHGSEELCATLVALLVPGEGVRLQEVALPPGAGARQVAELWAGAWGELAAQTGDSSGGVMLSTKL